MRSLRVLLAILALTLIGAASARAASPIEGVWSFGGGKIAISAEPSGAFTGTVVNKAKFSSCTHQVGEKVWTAITSQADGSFWGRHQWFSGGSCTPISTLGLSAWRILTDSSGSTYLAFCTSEPGSSSQPKISAAGVTSGAAECIDSGPVPDTTIASGPNGPTASASPGFTFTSTAAGTFECRLDSADAGAWSVCVSPVSYGPLAQGPHNFEVRAKSTLGDADPSPAASSFSVDTVAPETTIDSGPAGPISVPTAGFSFTSTEAGSFECRLDSSDPGDWTACSSPSDYGSLADGPHSFEVRAKDALGNTDATPAEAEFSVDTAAPETTIDSGPAGPIASAAVSFELGSSEEGSFECRLDSSNDADWEACDSPRSYASLADGPHRFEARATDLLGNTDPTPAVAQFSIDTKAPDARFVAVPEARISSVSGVATFAFDSTEPGSFECRLDSAPSWSACISPVSYSALAPGQHTFEVRAKDALGNTGPAASVAFAVDPPINGARVAVAPVSGRVRIQTPDADKFRPLLTGETIPVGSVVDTSQGKARLTSIDATGIEQSAAFSEGIFGVGQKPGKTLLSLRLRGGDFSGCSEAGSSATASGAKGRRLWGSGHGNFRTEGSYGSATVRGTIWLTEDRCDGTFVKVRRGVVAVRDFTKGKTFSVPAGSSYLAQPGG